MSKEKINADLEQALGGPKKKLVRVFFQIGAINIDWRRVPHFS